MKQNRVFYRDKNKLVSWKLWRRNVDQRMCAIAVDVDATVVPWYDFYTFGREVLKANVGFFEMTVTNDVKMSASEMVLNFDPGDSHEYEELFRFSPEGQADASREPYRCPVSTPADNRRPEPRSRPSSFVTFTNLNRSMSLPRHSSYQKYSNQRLLQSRRQMTKPQNKNMSDCYFVGKGGNSQVRVEGQVKSAWLSSLCSQPVNEIFGKYKRKTEAGQLTNASLRTRNLSTPGEKALFNAWTSNSSHRGTPSVSKSYQSGQTLTSRNARSVECDPDLRVYGYDHDPDRMITSPGFALMPVYALSDLDLEDAPESTRSSQVTRKTNKSSHSNNTSATNSNSYAGLSDIVPSAGSSIYDAYQRERKFPDVKRNRRQTFSPTKKRIIPPESKENVPVTARQELEESSIQIFSIGHFSDVEPIIHQSPIKTSEERPTSLPPCAYRLPKSYSMNLPEIKGKG